MSKFQFRAKMRALAVAKQVALENIALYAVAYYKGDVFDTASFDGKKWKERKKKDDSRTMLVKTGTLRASIGIRERGFNHRRVDSNVDYAKYHNEGTERLPKRQFLGNFKGLEKKRYTEFKKMMKKVYETGKAHK